MSRKSLFTSHFLQCVKVFWLYLREMIWGKNMNESVILSATKWSRRISLALVLAFLAACEEGTGELTWPDEFSAESSSSFIQPESSSSIVIISSSSIGAVSSSSVLPLSSSSNPLYEWSWDVPKEARMNPDIAYDSITDSRDGKVYKTVKIGDQVWMAENLNYDDSVQTPSLKERSWCFNNKQEHCNVTGRLYTWAAAIDSVALANDANNPMDCGNFKVCNFTGDIQGICPDGWHLPSHYEWDTLITTARNKGDAALVLRSSSGWGYGNGTDDFGFSMLPSGQKQGSNYFYSESDPGSAYFWTSSETGEHDWDAYYVNTASDPPSLKFPPLHNLVIGIGVKDRAYSVRCVKDEAEIAPE